MKKSLHLALLAAVLIAFTSACTHTVVNRLTFSRGNSATNPNNIKLYFSKKAIKRNYKVVAKYMAQSNSSSFNSCLDKVAIEAAKDGCDAVIVSSANRLKAFYWMFIFPFMKNYSELTFTGIKFSDNS